MEELQLKYDCFTDDEQREFDSLPLRAKRYCIFLAQGNKKSDAYQMAGYDVQAVAEGRPSTSMATLERRYPCLLQLSLKLARGNFKRELLKENSPASQEMDRKAQTAEQDFDATMQSSLVEMGTPEDKMMIDMGEVTSEQARNVQFYRQIANGVIKTIKKVTRYNAEGQVVEVRVEETSDVETRIKAQKEVMRLVGIQDVIATGQIKASDTINIMIVDASKKGSATPVEPPLEMQEAQVHEDAESIQLHTEESEKAQSGLVEDEE